MTVERNVYIKVIDSLNFLPMKLSALSKPTRHTNTMAESSMVAPNVILKNSKTRTIALTNQSLKELYALTLKKIAYIEQLGMNYVCVSGPRISKTKVPKRRPETIYKTVKSALF